jgi:predicted esterase
VPVGFLAAQAEDVVGLVAAAQGDEQRTAEQVRQVGFSDGGALQRGRFAT